MSIYQLKIITAGSERIVILPQNKALTVQAMPDSQYKIINEQGELLDIQINQINVKDLAVSLENAVEPNVIIENYYTYYPTTYSATENATMGLITPSEQVLATSVSNTIIAKSVFYGLGTLATLASGALLFGRGGKLFASKSQNTLKSAAKVEPINVDVQMDPLTADNIINQTEHAATVAISGVFKSDQTFTSAKVLLTIGDQQIDASVDGYRFIAEVSGELLAAHDQVQATVILANGKSSGTGQVSHHYAVDTQIAHPQITFNPVTVDNVLNLAESQVTQHISGKVSNIEHSAAKAGDSVTLKVGQESFKGRLGEDLSFSIPVSGQLLSKNSEVVATLETADAAGNQLSSQVSHHYAVDTQIAHPQITFNPVTVDNVLNLAESQVTQHISGKVSNIEHSAAKAGDSVTLKVGQESFKGRLGEDLSFSIPVSGQLLSKNSEVVVTLETADAAGNQLSSQVSHHYAVDTQIAHPQITFNPVTEDNIINAVESKTKNLTVSGKVTNVEHSAAKAGDSVTLKVGQARIKGRLGEDLSFSIPVSGQLLSKNSEVVATLETADAAGNQLSSQVRHHYAVDTQIAHPQITFNPVTVDNVLNLAESQVTQHISGKVSNIEHSAAKAGDSVTLKVGQERFKGRLGEDLSFSIPVSGQLLSKNSEVVVTLETADAAGNQLSSQVSHHYAVDTQIAHPQITFNPVTEDNIINAVESKTKNLTVSGKVTNVEHSAAKAGDSVTLKVGQARIKGRLGEDLSFSIPVSGQLLSKNSEVVATLETADAAGNQLSSQVRHHYAVDTQIAHPKITFNPVTVDNVLNLAESQVTQHISGKVSNIEHSAAKAGDSITLKVGQESFKGRLGEDLSFSIPVSGQLLSKNSEVVVTLETADAAGNQLSSQVSHHYAVDTQIAHPQITFNPVTEDNIINAVESKTKNLTVSGKVTNVEHSAAKAGDSVTLKVGQARIKGRLGEDLSFSIPVSGQLLSKNSEVVATLETADAAGNQLSSQVRHHYAVDTQIAHPQITFNPVTVDNVLNLAESQVTQHISGKVSNIEHSAAKAGDSVTLKVGQERFKGRLGEDLSFSIPVSGQLLSKNSEVVVTLETADAAGNQLSSQVSHHYAVDTQIAHPQITFNPVTVDNVLNLAESQVTQHISGKVSNIEHSAAKAGDSVTLKVGQESFKGRLGEDLSFSIPVSGQLLSKNSEVVVTLETADAAGNQLSSQVSHHYAVDTQIAHPQITFNPVTEDNIINAVESKTKNLTVSGKVTNVEHSAAKAGDSVTLKVGQARIKGRLGEDLSFSIPVSGQLLSKNSEVVATLETADAAGNQLSSQVRHHYAVDTQIAHPQITFNPVTVDNVLNLAESQVTQHISGKVSNIEHSAAKAGDSVTLKVGQERFKGRLGEDLSFSIPVSGQLLSKNSEVVVTLETADAAGNQLSSQVSHHYAVDTQIAHPQITFNPVTVDNVLNLAESQVTQHISGKVSNIEHSAAKAGDSVTLKVGQERFKGRLGEDLSFSIPVSGQLLSKNSEVVATLETADAAGNQLSSQVSHHYAVDTQIAHPQITFNPVTVDNVLNLAESQVTQHISGKVSNIEHSAAKAGDSVTLKVGQERFKGRLGEDLSFSIPVSGQLLSKNSEVVATLETADAAGNQLSSQVRHHYAVDTQIAHPKITFNPVTVDNVLNLAESQVTQHISGKVTNVEHSAAKAGDSITLKVGQESFKGRLGEDLSFSIPVSGQLLSKNSEVVATLETADAAGNQLSSQVRHHYAVDTQIAHPQITFNPVTADNIINAVEARAENLTVSGKVENVAHSAAKAGDVVRLKVGELSLEAVLGEDLSFSVPVNTLALVNHNVIEVSLRTGDQAANQLTTTERAEVQVDTTLNLGVSVDDVTADNTLNRAESGGEVVLTGRYAADADVKTGSVSIALTIGGETYAAVVNEDEQSWRLAISGQNLTASQGENRLEVRISAADQAGNVAEKAQMHVYQVDTQIEKPVVTITQIAGDNVIDADEVQGDITISGTVENAEGDAPVMLKCPCSACAGGWKDVEAKVENGKFEVSVKVGDTGLAEAKLKSAQRLIKANYTAQDKAGNTAAADEASLKYELDLHSEINITQIGEGFQFAPAKMSRIYGTVTEFASWTQGGQTRDWYNQGQNAQNIRKVNVVIGEKTYTVGFNGKTKTFQVDIPSDELKALAGKAVSLNFDDDIMHKYARIYGATFDQNSQTWRIADEVNRVPTVKAFTLDSAMLEKTGDNQYQVKAAAPEMTEISGVAKGSLAKVGAAVEIKIGDTLFAETVTLKDDKTFSVQVPTALLKANADKTVTATLKETGGLLISDTESYVAENQSAADFVSQHSEMPQDNPRQKIFNRKIDHTKEDYNFFYPIALSEVGYPPKYGFHRNYEVGGAETPLTVKYHFAKEADLANLLQHNFDGKDLSSKPLMSLDGHDELKQYMRTSYETIARYTNLKFEETDNYQDVLGRKGTLVMLGNFDRGYAVGAAAIAYSGSNLIWNTAKDYKGGGLNYLSYLTLHEITHTLNMDHSDGPFRSAGQVSEISTEFLNMSYSQNGMFSEMRDLRLYDLAYLHYRFGVNREHRAGNDVYTFKKYNARSADGDVYIWDGNGVDTFDASNEKEGVTVNLTPGSWNYVGTEKKKQFLGIDPTTYDKNSYFGLDASEKFSTAFRGKVQTVKFSNYQEGQSFIGYGTQIENLIGSAFDDVLTGNNADNQIFGGDGVDTIKGGLGNDFINGGLGADLMFGEQGDDVYVVDNAGDVVTEKANEGTDLVYSLIDYTLDDNVENLTLIGTTAKSGKGNALNNIIRGNDAGNSLNGLDGDDVLIGGLGADTLTGGTGKDTFVFESSLNGKADTITDFTAGEDKIQLSKAVFSVLNDDLGNLKAHLFYDSASGELSYNSGNTGADNAVHFATVKGLGVLDETYFSLV